MNDKPKPCSFCEVDPHEHQAHYTCKTPYCPANGGVYVTLGIWNYRPLENKLKDAIQELLKAIEFSIDKDLKRYLITARLKEARATVHRILGIAKTKK